MANRPGWNDGVTTIARTILLADFAITLLHSTRAYSAVFSFTILLSLASILLRALTSGRGGRGMPMHSRKRSRKRIAQPFEMRVDGWHRGAGLKTYAARDHSQAVPPPT